MSRRRRRALLVPEARAALDQLRDDVITQQFRAPSQVISQHPRQLGTPELHRDKGELTTRQAGKMGGQIGGTMVQRLVSIAKQELTKQQGKPD